MEVLKVGDKFAGCNVEASTDVETGHVWVFSRGNEAVVFSMPYEDYFTFICNPYEREFLLDEMAKTIHVTLRDREKKPSTLDVKP